MISQTEAALFRYHEDVPAKKKSKSPALEVVVSEMVQRCLEITPEILPSIDKLLCDVCHRIGINRKDVVAFVLESQQLQASCINCIGGTCVLQVSSGLINLLESDEICFVLGHELGHFALCHESDKVKDESVGEQMFISRAAEISADRFGLVACESIDVSLRAIMKTISGLDSKFLRFDVAKFIESLRKNKVISRATEHSSHPSLIVRARALIWFSLVFQKDVDNRSVAEIKKMNARVSRDLHRFIDGGFREFRDSLKKGYYKWKTVQLIHETPIDVDQWAHQVELEFGSSAVAELKEFFNDDFSIVAEDIQNRLHVLEEQIDTEHPRTSKSIIDESTERAYKLLNLLD